MHHFPSKRTNFAFFLIASKATVGTGMNFFFQDFKYQTLKLLLVMNVLESILSTNLFVDSNNH